MCVCMCMCVGAGVVCVCVCVLGGGGVNVFNVFNKKINIRGGEKSCETTVQILK